MSRGTLRDAFAAYGVKLRWPRQSWSGRADDGDIVVLALWRDMVRINDGKPTYSEFNNHAARWFKRPGNRERLNNLVWARDRCGGIFRVVLVRAEDPTSATRSIVDAYPQRGWRMRLVELNEETGEFRAECVT